MKTQTQTPTFVQFRQQVYQNLTKRVDSAMELLDALCSTPDAYAVVELSLSPHFRRTYTALYKAIDENDWDQLNLARLAGSCAEASKKRPYWLMGLDGTSQRRQYAQALTDRGYVYYPNSVAGNKPVTIGHEYSTVALLPEDAPDRTRSWVVPLAVERVSTQDDKELVGAEQIKALLEDDQLPWHGELVVETGDSRYSKPAYLHAVHEDHPNLVSVVRVRGNRTLYHYLEPPEENPPHRPKYKGKVFKLPDADTHTSPDETVTLEVETKRGQTHTVELEAWTDMVMPGKNKPVRIPMENYPFRLVRVARYDQGGEMVFARPVWLIIVGKRQAELSLEDIYEAYFSRSRLEHFFRFGKQKLLLNDFQTPETPREETWWRICHLAYLMLWKALPLAQHHPRPWERNLPQNKQKVMSPSLVQRDFSRLISQFGTPAQPPKPRGKSPGRPQGFRLPPRKRHSVVYKGQNQASAA